MRSHGSVRGAISDGRPYRDHVWSAAELQAKKRRTGLVCANVYGLHWSEKTPGHDGIRYALFPFTIAVLEDCVRMRVLRAPDLTVVPSHGSPANLAGKS
jgi:hypothetical protein